MASKPLLEPLKIRVPRLTFSVLEQLQFALRKKRIQRKIRGYLGGNKLWLPVVRKDAGVLNAGMIIAKLLSPPSQRL